MRNLGYRQLEELADSALISPRARQTPREFWGWGGVYSTEQTEYVIMGRGLLDVVL